MRFARAVQHQVRELLQFWRMACSFSSQPPDVRRSVTGCASWRVGRPRAQRVGRGLRGAVGCKGPGAAPGRTALFPCGRSENGVINDQPLPFPRGAAAQAADAATAVAAQATKRIMSVPALSGLCRRRPELLQLG